MDKEQALQIMSNIIDGTIKAGLFHNKADVANALQAYQVISEIVLPQPKKAADNGVTAK